MNSRELTSLEINQSANDPVLLEPSRLTEGGSRVTKRLPMPLPLSEAVGQIAHCYLFRFFVLTTAVVVI
jgi:hypothetical protein